MDGYGCFRTYHENGKMKIKKINGLPLFEAQLAGEDCGVLRVSLVDAPAVDSDFRAYGEQSETRVYSVLDEDKRRVLGVVLRADYPIYREDGNGAYYIVFRPDQIRAFAQKYLADGLQNEVDLHHDFVSIEGAQMVQYYIKDSAGGISPKGFEGIADGSLFAEYQITDEALWQRVKEGEFKGFSVEIIHTEIPVEYKTQTNNKKNMSKLTDKMKAGIAAFVKAIDCFGSVATDNGTLMWDGEEDLKAGDAVYTEDAEGNRIDAADGEYKTEDGKVIVVAEGKVSEIKDAEAEVAPETNEMEGEETPEDKDARIAELEAKVAEQEAALAEKDARIAELEEKLKTPAGDSAHDAFKKVEKKAAVSFMDVYNALK